MKLYDGTEPRGTVVGQGNYLQSYEGELADFAAVVLDGAAPAARPSSRSASCGPRSRCTARRRPTAGNRSGRTHERSGAADPLAADRPTERGPSGPARRAKNGNSMSGRVTFDYSGAAVLVTGGTSGIGHGIATAYRDAGAAVTITGTRAAADEYDTDLAGFDATGSAGSPKPTRSTRSPRRSTGSTSS